MELSVQGIVAFSTLILGQITKKLGLVDKKYIPLQSIVVGLLSGFICYITEVQSNLLTAMVTCTISSLSASGLYDAATIRNSVSNDGEVE